MSLLEQLSSPSRALRLDDLEDAFRSWAHDPAEPDRVLVGQHRQLAMTELARRLTGSQATLPERAWAQLGLPDGVTIAIAATQPLGATIDPDGLRCRSVRSARHDLRGLAELRSAIDAISPIPDDAAEATERPPDVR